MAKRDARHRWLTALGVALPSLLLAVPLFAQSPSDQPPAPSPASADAAPPASSPAQDAGGESGTLAAAKQVAEQVAETVRGQSLQLGLGYVQNTAKFSQFKDLSAPGVSAQITDNGRIAPLIEYSSAEKAFRSYPLQQGRAVFGYNLIVTYEQFDLNRQLVDSPFVGKDLGTRLQGDYVAVAPLVFGRLGPLYPGREIYWKFGVGAGIAYLRYKGDIVATKNGASQTEHVEYNASSPSLFETAVWELQVERWLLLFKSLYVAGGGPHEGFTIEQYGLTLAYTFTF